MYSNSQILAAVLNRWAQPIVKQLSNSQLSKIPALYAIESKVKSSGWVSPSWSVGAELQPFVEAVTGSLIEPLLCRYLQNVPDESIPALAYGIVDRAIENGELTLLEGKLTFDKDDLGRLRRLLDANLPKPKTNNYKVKENEL